MANIVNAHNHAFPYYHLIVNLLMKFYNDLITVTENDNTIPICMYITMSQTEPIHMTNCIHTEHLLQRHGDQQPPTILHYEAHCLVN